MMHNVGNEIYKLKFNIYCFSHVDCKDQLGWLVHRCYPFT